MEGYERLKIMIKQFSFEEFESRGLILLKGAKTAGCSCGSLPPEEDGNCVSCIVHDNFRIWFRRSIDRLKKVQDNKPSK